MNTPENRTACSSRAGEPKLLVRLHNTLRVRHYSIRTEQAYVDWVRRFVRFHGLRHPVDMGAREVQAFLTYLAVQRHVAAATQNQAKSALLFLYRAVLGVELPWLNDVERAKPSGEYQGDYDNRRHAVPADQHTIIGISPLPPSVRQKRWGAG